MAGVQGSALCIAVSNAGGLGSLPCAILGVDALRAELAAIRAQTSKPYNVNFFCHTPPTPSLEREVAWQSRLSPYFTEFGIDQTVLSKVAQRAPFAREAADVLSEFKPPVVSFHFGLPSAGLLERVRSWGAKFSRRRPLSKRRAGSKRAVSTPSSRRAWKPAVIEATF